MTTLKSYRCTLAATAAVLVCAGAAAQDIIAVEPPAQQEIRNFVGLGAFSVPDFYGSSNNKAAAVPLARYSWDGTSYIQLLGPELSMNLMPDRQWRAGPLIRFRPRRDDEVDDEIVKRMRPIPSATEIGAFAAYHMPLDPNHPLHKLVLGGDIVANTTGVYNGVTGNLRVTYYYPFPQAVAGQQLVGTIGLGMFIASDSFNRKYFGVGGSDLNLFPELGGRPYNPGSGLTSVKIPFSLSTQVNRQWLLSFAGRYERLLNDAKDSPVVNRRGDANQWQVGIAATYLFGR
jgi:outer membrane scaffolding protein for murein synthesis (MipA/OmpV family)